MSSMLPFHCFSPNKLQTKLLLIQMCALAFSSFFCYILLKSLCLLPFYPFCFNISADRYVTPFFFSTVSKSKIHFNWNIWLYRRQNYSPSAKNVVSIRFLIVRLEIFSHFVNTHATSAGSHCFNAEIIANPILES